MSGGILLSPIYEALFYIEHYPVFARIILLMDSQPQANGDYSGTKLQT